jgi:hypothetical protein
MGMGKECINYFKGSRGITKFEKGLTIHRADTCSHGLGLA